MTVIIESDRLVIREWAEADADAALADLRVCRCGSVAVARDDKVPNKATMRACC